MQLSLRSLSIGAYQDFPAEGETLSDEAVAGTVARILGPVSGTGILSLAPEAALRLVAQDADEASPIEAFAILGRKVLQAFAADAIKALGGAPASVEVGVGSLVEDSRPAILIRTHAPGDTVLISVGIDLLRAPGSLPIAIFIDLLLEPKVISARLL